MKILVRHNYTKEKINNNNKEKIKFIAIVGGLEWINRESRFRTRDPKFQTKGLFVFLFHFFFLV